MMKIRRLAFIVGLWMTISFYIVMAATVVLAFVRPNHVVNMYFNLYGEMNIELLIVLFSIPFIIFFVKVCIEADI